MLIFLLAQHTNSLSVQNLLFHGPVCIFVPITKYLFPLKCVAFTTFQVLYRKPST